MHISIKNFRRIDRLALSLLCFTPLLFHSLQAEEYAQQIVLEAYPKWYSSDNITIQGNIGIEKLFKERDWVSCYGKPSMTYALDRNWALHGGLGYYYTDYKQLNDTYEIRPFLGISHFTNLTDKWSISTYFRTEERYCYSTETDGRSKNTRLRLRFRTAYLFNSVSIPERWHRATLGIEGFKSYNTDDSLAQFYDYQTNITLGLERSLEKKQKLRFELAWKYKAALDHIRDASISTVYFRIQYYPRWGDLLRNRLMERDIDE